MTTYTLTYLHDPQPGTMIEELITFSQPVNNAEITVSAFFSLPGADAPWVAGTGSNDPGCSPELLDAPWPTPCAQPITPFVYDLTLNGSNMTGVIAAVGYVDSVSVNGVTIFDPPVVSEPGALGLMLLGVVLVGLAVSVLDPFWSRWLEYKRRATREALQWTRYRENHS